MIRRDCDDAGVRMSVRRATIDDLDELLDVQQEGAVAGLAHIFAQDAYPFPRETLAQRWSAEFADPAIHIYVSTDPTGSIIGFAAVRGTELMHFGTALRTWGTGTAQALHDAVVRNWILERAGDFEFLSLRVFADNVRARRFYERLGWEPTGRVSRTSFPPHPVLLEYRLRVSPGPDSRSAGGHASPGE
jgi:RimJ/RimL family protein N-acetyltransferase